VFVAVAPAAARPAAALLPGQPGQCQQGAEDAEDRHAGQVRQKAGRPLQHQLADARRPAGHVQEQRGHNHVWPADNALASAHELHRVRGPGARHYQTAEHEL